ncbi:MAG: hypothetical protein IH945_05730 [Armatimonadetes bacterium]|nr:hypothetical protein [Armatimonadota bacterium]
MRLIRAIVVAASAMLLAGGYVSSQMAFVASNTRGTLTPDAAKNYAASMDVPAIRMVALLILVACIVLVIVRDPAEGAD